MSNDSLIALDSLRNSLTRTVHMVSLIQSAIENKVLADEADAPESLFCVWQQLWDISHQFSDILDSEFSRRKAALPQHSGKD